MPQEAEGKRVFISYAHKDEALRKRLDTHLALMQRQGLIQTWHDRQIRAGMNWAEAIDTQLEEAAIILLLISADFVASDYCYGIEMTRALERHAAGQARVIPIIVRPVDWTTAPFARLQALPTNGKAITSWKNRDEALADVATGLRKAIAEAPTHQHSLSRTSFPPIWNVPYPRNMLFTGREELLAQLATSLHTGQPTAISQPPKDSQPQAISGLGGIGKTQVALEYAYRYRSEWTDQAEAKREIAMHIEALAHTIVERATNHPVQRARFLNLPFHRNPYFTGREEVLEQMHRSLHQHHTSALVQAITGLGGIGKTQTAVEYAYRYQHEYDTILWVGAESPEVLITDYTRLARLLALPEREEQEQSLVIQAVIRWMETQEHWLLILDNVENLDAVRGFLPHTGNEHLLLTTRSQIVGEFAAPVLVDAMETETGALLLLRRAKLIAPSLMLYTPSFPSQLREDALTLTRELDGLPLALDQAGAYIEATSCGITGYVELYTTNRNRLLGERGPFGKDHPASVVTTWSLSFQQVEQQNPTATEIVMMK